MSGPQAGWPEEPRLPHMRLHPSLQKIDFSCPTIDSTVPTARCQGQGQPWIPGCPRYWQAQAWNWFLPQRSLCTKKKRSLNPAAQLKPNEGDQEVFVETGLILMRVNVCDETKPKNMLSYPSPTWRPWVSGLVGHFVQTWPDSELLLHSAVLRL